MDDVFFSDKPNQKNGKRKTGTQNALHKEIKNDDAFSGKPARTEKDRFVVNMPDEEKPVVLRDRTPKGRPVSSDAVTPRVPEYQLSQATAFDDSVYLRSDPQSQQQTPIASMQHRPPQPRPTGSNPSRTSGQPRKKKGPAGKKNNRIPKWKIVLSVLIVLFVAFTAVFAYGYHVLGKVGFDKEYSHVNEYMDSSALSSSPRVRNILCIGSDARGDVDGRRSDTMVLVSIDSVHHKLKMTSFLRDCYVYIPAKGFHAKLNAAFSWGGAKMLVDTIEYNFKVRVDDYVIIDFVGFQKLIDLMGGLDVDGVTADEAKYMRDVVKIVYCKEGKNHFSGAAALWYCRIRKLDDDFHRTERQRKVMLAIIKQALHRNPFELMKIVEQVLPVIQTSMSRNDLLSAGFSAVLNYIGGKNPQHQVPAEDTWHSQRINGQDVLKMDLDRNVSLLKDFIY